MSPPKKRITGDMTICKAELEKMSVQLRQRFLKEAEDNPNEYNEEDVTKMGNDDYYCQRFILHQRYLLDDKADVNAAFEQCKLALKWRKEHAVTSIKESNLSIEMFEKRGIFPYGKDKLGNDILVLICKLNKRDAELQAELRRFIIYWIEKLDKKSNGNKINVILNCESAGISNLDLDIIRFLISIFRQNYPYFLENIFVLNMPWIFNAAWSLIKSWLPEDAVDIIKFVNKKTILDYIDEESLPVSMGGLIPDEDINIELADYKRACKEQLEEIKLRKTMEERDSRHYLEIKPADVLTFKNPEVTDRKLVFLVLKNVHHQEVGFRIRSNSKTTFKVRPFNGVIKSGSSLDVSVHLLEGHSLNGQEKFMIQAIPVGHSKLSPASFNALWKSSNSNKQMEYKIKCQYEDSQVVPKKTVSFQSENLTRTTVTPLHSMNDNTTYKIRELEKSVLDLKYWNRFLKIAVFAIVLVHLLFFCAFVFTDKEGFGVWEVPSLLLFGRKSSSEKPT